MQNLLPQTLDELEVFFGDASHAEARIYARLPLAAPAGELRLRGCVIGPSCLYSRTLAATMPMVDRGPGATLLAEAVVPDPCFWSPDLPMLYRVEVELISGQESLAKVERTIGIRPLGAAGPRLFLEGKNWVLRGVERKHCPAATLAEWRDAGAAMVVDDPDDALLAEASRIGAIIVANETGAADIARLSRWPAAAMAIISDAVELRIPNLLLVQRLRAGDPQTAAPWAQVVLLQGDDAGQLALWAERLIVPAIAHRPLGETMDLLTARSACDALQRDLAGRANFAGFMV